MADKYQPGPSGIHIIVGKAPTNGESDSDSSSSSSSIKGPPSKKKLYTQKFKDSWLSEPVFAPWLAKSSKSNLEAKCHVCNKVFCAKRSALVQHEKTVAHQEQMRVSGKGVNTEMLQILCHKGSIKRAELRYVLDIVEHGRSFNSCDRYVDTIPDVHAECNCSCPTIQNLRLKRTKVSALIKNVINKAIIEKVANILKHTFFSILIGESTDAENSNNFAILARYIHENKIHSYVLEYISIKSGTADNLFKCFEYALAKHNIPIKNIVGISSDNANVMVGEHPSFITLFKERNSEVVIIPCICQKLNVIAIEACKFIPDNVNKLMHRIFNYTGQSGKRIRELEELQIFASRHRMVEPLKTKWLSMSKCIPRLLEQWAVLLAYFEDENNPSVALDIQKHENHIENILQVFKSKFDDEDVLQEWYFLGFLEEKIKNELLSLSINDFWIKIIQISNERSQKFKNICKLAYLCLTLPNSNVEIKRLFSLVNNIRTRNRNRLGHRMVGALCRIRIDLDSMGTKCCNYPITEEILNNFNSRMYKDDDVPDALSEIIVQDQMSSDDDDVELHNFVNS
ncbi:uncharacterized protein LOC117218265 isoform X5 [Megalopta genalis]|uniref:uncharacterized protein LOC117218265 isoform X5 n=1 Tax=Megalopta genalis TaxID=115081 RepID=UPI003FD03728